MTKSQIKDAIRNIKKNFVSYISILLISMLSIATYMGVSSASVNLENGASDFYKDSNFYDIEVFSTLLLNDSDIEAFRGLESVESVVPFYYTNGSCENKDEQENVNIISDTGDVCVPYEIEGSRPESENECMIEDRLAESLKYKIGDKINITGNDGGTASYLKESSFVITGIFKTPLHIKPSVNENSYIIMNDSSFDTEKLRGCYMRAYIRIKDRGDGNYFSEDYEAKVNSVKKEIENLASEHTALRDAEIRDYYQSEIDKNEKTLNDAKDKLDASNASLTDAEEKIKKGNNDLEKASKELDDLKKQLGDGKKKLDTAKTELDKSKATLDASKKLLDTSKVELDQKRALLDDAKNKLDTYDKEISDNEAKLEAAAAELKDGEAKLSDAKAKLDEGEKTLDDSFMEVENWKTGARNRVKGIINRVMEIAGISVDINWSSEITDIDLRNVNISDFYLTDSIKIDLLNDDVGTVIEKVMTALNLSQYYDREKYEEIEKAVQDFLDTIGADRAAWREKVNSYRDKLREWNTGRQTYLESLDEYNSGCVEYDKKSEEYKAAEEKVKEARSSWNTQKAEYDAGEAAYNSAYSEYEAGYNKYITYKNEWDKKNREYLAGLKEYDTGSKAYDTNSAKYDEGLKKLADSEEEFKKNKQKYQDGLSKYEDGCSTLDSMKSQLEELKKCEWIVSGVEANVGYKHMGMTVDSLQNLGNNFTILFVVLASLIIYATIARIISEQHKLVGTTKAFGFYVREILLKYMLFGVTGLLVGYLLGTLVSFGFEKFALSVFVKNYVIAAPAAKPVYSVMIIVFAVGMLITIAAVVFATVSLLRKPAVELLRDSSPKGVKGNGSDRHIFPLFQRLIFRNIITDKLRVIVTMAGIAGCTALVNIGFTMKYDFSKTETIEYDDRLRYDLDIEYNDDEASDIKDAEDIYKKYGAQYADCMSYYGMFKTAGGSEIVETVVTDTATVQDFYDFTSPADHKTVELGKEGVYLKSGYADSYNIKVGDEITILSKSGEEGQVTVAGFYENYIGQKLYMDTDYYKSVFSEDPQFNKCMLKFSGDDNDELKEKLQECPAIHKIQASDEDRKEFSSYFKSLNALLILILAGAVLMAAIIISNLTFMYIVQKKLEILVMRINGYSLGEVRTYILRESIITTILGIIVGLLGGSLLGTSIIKSFEKPHLQLYSGINLKAWLMSALVTILFSVVINSLALRKVKKMQMTDISNVK